MILSITEGHEIPDKTPANKQCQEINSVRWMLEIKLNLGQDVAASSCHP